MRAPEGALEVLDRPDIHDEVRRRHLHRKTRGRSSDSTASRKAA